MHSEHVDDLIDEYALGALDDHDLERVARHVQVCPPCRRQAWQAEDAFHLLALSVTPLSPPARCKARLLATIDRAQFLATPTPRPRRVTTRAALWPAFGALAALLLVLVWAVQLQREVSSMRRSTALAQTTIATVQRENATMRAQLASFSELERLAAQAAAVRRLQGIGVGGSAWAETYMTPGKNEAVLVAHRLPPLPPDKVYQVWVARDSHQQPLTTFTVNNSDLPVMVEIAPPEPMDRYEEIMVTVEPAGGATRPSSQTVLAGKL